MNCAYCGHPEANHCKGGKEHKEWKEDQRQWKVTRITTCVSRHCDNAMCCCVDFKAPESRAELAQYAQAIDLDDLPF